MGWSCTTTAANTMRAIEHRCIEQQQAQQQPSSNTFTVGNKRYFYEQTRKDQPDGGICGAIWLCIGETHARKVGTFKIDGKGRIVRGPKFFRDAVA